MSANIHYILDFDSTLVKAETLELAAELAAGDADLRERIRAITCQAMEGRMEFHRALTERLILLHLHRDLLPELTARLLQEITPSFRPQPRFLAGNAGRIYVVTSSFRSVVTPVVERLGLRAEHVHANSLILMMPAT